MERGISVFQSGLKLIAMLAIAGLFAIAATSRYRSAKVDSAGRLRLVLDSGAEELAPKASGQVSFGEPAISPDRRTVGWLVLYPQQPGNAIAGALILYRDGRVLHRFRTQQTFWDWQFQDEGKRVAYSTGPTHGGAAECVLRDVETGRVAARWPVRTGGAPPVWARTLRM